MIAVVTFILIVVAAVAAAVGLLAREFATLALAVVAVCLFVALVLLATGGKL